MAAYLLQADDLPPGFRFPEAFLDMMSMDEIPHFQPWWFLMKFPGEAQEWLGALQEDFPERSLIPFAKYGTYSEVACFDGTDLSGDPTVFFVNSEGPPGHEVAGQALNFAAWLEGAKEDAAEWAAQHSGNWPTAPMQGAGEAEILPPAAPKA